jgi:hypothetical protein
MDLFGRKERTLLCQHLCNGVYQKRIALLFDFLQGGNVPFLPITRNA